MLSKMVLIISGKLKSKIRRALAEETDVLEMEEVLELSQRSGTVALLRSLAASSLRPTRCEQLNGSLCSLRIDLLRTDHSFERCKYLNYLCRESAESEGQKPTCTEKGLLHRRDSAHSEFIVHQHDSLSSLQQNRVPFSKAANENNSLSWWNFTVCSIMDFQSSWEYSTKFKRNESTGLLKV